MNKKQREQAEAVATLKEWGLADGVTVYAKVNHVSASGMSRNIGLYIAKAEYSGDLHGMEARAEIIDISYHAARALEWGYKEGYAGGVKVGGCGMDMMFHTVSSLSYVMGYGSLCQDPRQTEPEKKRGQKGEDILAIGLKYRAL